MRQAKAQVLDRPPLPALGEVLDFMRLLWGLDHALQRASKRMETTLGRNARTHTLGGGRSDMRAPMLRLLSRVRHYAGVFWSGTSAAFARWPSWIIGRSIR